MWLGQVISSLGDRVHQIALGVPRRPRDQRSPLALGLVFAAMTIPTSLVGPDRRRARRPMGSQMGHGRLGPDAGGAGRSPSRSSPELSIGLVVVLVFLLAVASSFFRPARAAALPQVVPDEDLLTANSAMWIADTVSDLVGYGLGGLFVAFLGSALSLAFWIDGASYLASAALVAAVTIPPADPAGGRRR